MQFPKRYIFIVIYSSGRWTTFIDPEILRKCLCKFWLSGKEYPMKKERIWESFKCTHICIIKHTLTHTNMKSLQSHSFLFVVLKDRAYNTLQDCQFSWGVSTQADRGTCLSTTCLRRSVTSIWLQRSRHLALLYQSKRSSRNRSTCPTALVGIAKEQSE
jgi:hypothetical protein